MTDRPRDTRKVSYRILAGLAVLTGAASLIAVYGIATTQGNRTDAACRGAVKLAEALQPLARGEVAALTLATTARAVPPLVFVDGRDQVRSLADWRGRTVLLNLWATWCIPCRKEMPALDALQGQLGSEGFEVVSVNIDTRQLDKPRAWLREAGLTRLGYYADPSAKIFQELKAVGRAFGMPTTLLVDPQGCEIAALAGAAEWASADAVAFVSAAVKGAPAGQGGRPQGETR